MSSEIERLAVLEDKMETMEVQHMQLMGKFDSLLETFTKYRGFAGGIMFTLTTIGTVIGTLVTWWISKPAS